ncbi:hypothetical protein CEE69_30905 [Rhodopirellula bahusiensis]|uniref:Uncharacterized protein n=1 Tax=Rhodopirellula bahusiensis TaxID=2014065 RepID=A0A2G1VXF5_9BACT|nr:hypothetical protein CEE69_30905 [Rhodopirellula bahusiensis]
MDGWAWLVSLTVIDRDRESLPDGKDVIGCTRNARETTAARQRPQAMLTMNSQKSQPMAHMTTLFCRTESTPATACRNTS